MGADEFGAVIAPRCPVTGGLPTRMTETAFRRALHGQERHGHTRLALQALQTATTPADTLPTVQRPAGQLAGRAGHNRQGGAHDYQDQDQSRRRADGEKDNASAGTRVSG